MRQNLEETAGNYEKAGDFENAAECYTRFLKYQNARRPIQNKELKKGLELATKVSLNRAIKFCHEMKWTYKEIKLSLEKEDVEYSKNICLKKIKEYIRNNESNSVLSCDLFPEGPDKNYDAVVRLVGLIKKKDINAAIEVCEKAGWGYRADELRKKANKN